MNLLSNQNTANANDVISKSRSVTNENGRVSQVGADTANWPAKEKLFSTLSAPGVSI